MTTIHVVVYTVGGYCREDADIPECAGAYTDAKVANVVAKIVRGKVVPIELDVVQPGYQMTAKALGYKLQ